MGPKVWSPEEAERRGFNIRAFLSSPAPAAPKAGRPPGSKKRKRGANDGPASAQATTEGAAGTPPGEGGAASSGPSSSDASGLPQTPFVRPAAAPVQTAAGKRKRKAASSALSTRRDTWVFSLCIRGCFPYKCIGVCIASVSCLYPCVSGRIVGNSIHSDTP